MKWSFKLGKLPGIDVYLHFTFLLLLENISEMIMVNAAMDHPGAAHSLPPKLSTQNL